MTSNLKMLSLMMLYLILSGTSLYAQAGLRGDYYEGTNFNRKVRTRIDRKIDFNWKNRAPIPELDWSFYSIRWTGQLVAPASGEYIFTCDLDDGIRLWIGNKLVIDEWHLTPVRRFEGKITLEANRTYPIRVDYYNDIMGGLITLRWERPDKPKKWYEAFADRGEPVDASFFRQPPPSAEPKPTVAEKPPKPTLSPKVPYNTAERIVNRKSAPAAPAPKPIPVTPPVLVTETPRPTAPPAALRPRAVPLTIFFDQSSYELTEAGRQLLDSTVRFWQRHPPAGIDVIGHADLIGDRARNRTLSEYRTRVIMHHLARLGVDPNRLHGRWHGDTLYYLPDSVTTGSSGNRRVVIIPHYDATTEQGKVQAKQ